VDKVTLVLLEATLRDHLDPGRVADALPALRQLFEPAESVRSRATACANELQRTSPDFALEVVATQAQAGSGALPAQAIASHGIALTHAQVSPEELARRLRLGAPPVISRLHDGRVLLDFRTVLRVKRASLRGPLRRQCPRTTNSQAANRLSVERPQLRGSLRRSKASRRLRSGVVAFGRKKPAQPARLERRDGHAVVEQHPVRGDRWGRDPRA
jgi:hypothetical protein